MAAARSSENPLVSIIILNYNGRAFLEPCLRSVLAQTYHPIEVLFVDNASTDSSVQFVREQFPSITIVENERNLGFTGGNNVGFSRSRGELVALLNNDTVVDERWLEALVEVLHSQDAVLVCSRVETEGVPPEFYEMNGTLNYLGHNIMRQFADRSMIFYASAASMLLRRKCVDTLFPDEYFLYCEDVQLSWRLRLQGSHPLMVQSSVVKHRGSSTTQRHPPSLISFYQERNRLLNCLTLYEGWTLLRLVPYFLLDLVATLAMSVAGLRKSFGGVIRAVIWFPLHAGWIWKQRRAIQSTRKVPDKEIMSVMSANLLNGQGRPARMANALSRLYASLVGLAYYG